ncbi:diaminopimelate dehydrogenase [Miniphocaeibacter halophilus]|uniref:Diaminopimelate dehydrogenase n=1 Tax=Miniphocaeibacter halophilus TaxID=2931922 RepID=A0AC61MSI5_9FIRM|nr:diaminopimelate dehydrogenase [Miniphocaeibacter halophilus]QQK07575.1 diaminopimelate dehydrogenase [Miniphocaeibacter halophilus]
MEKIKIGIIGYGNLGKGAEKAVKLSKDMELVGIFTRRNKSEIDSDSNIYNISELEEFKGDIDVCILCGGSATDLWKQGPEIAKNFNTVDSFDTHAKIPEYFSQIDGSAKSGNNLSLISTGWDPGLFSIHRLFSQSIMPVGETYTFWGKGVSQGHGDAIRQIEGVKDAVQYTIPVEKVISEIQSGNILDLTTRDKHIRECYVVVEEEADKNKIENEIKSMPNYFSDYDTYVNFVSEDELKLNHSGMPHGGRVLRIGKTSENIKQIYEFKLDLGSNPEFTSAINVAYARAVYRLNKEGTKGAISVFDVPVSYLSIISPEEQRRLLL